MANRYIRTEYKGQVQLLTRSRFQNSSLRVTEDGLGEGCTRSLFSQLCLLPPGTKSRFNQVRRRGGRELDFYGQLLCAGFCDVTGPVSLSGSVQWELLAPFSRRGHRRKVRRGLSRVILPASDRI